METSFRIGQSGVGDFMTITSGGVHIGLDYQAITVTLVKAIQELSTKLEEATTRINALESR